MTNKQVISLSANEEFKINANSYTTIKTKINSGSLTFTGKITSEDGTVLTSELNAIGDKDLTITSTITDTNQIFTISAVGYDSVTPSANCVITVLTERY